VGALTHVYAALLCGGLGAGLLIFALFSHRRDLVRPGLGLGLSVSVVFAVWLSIAWSSLGNLSWIQFSPRAVFDAAWYVRNLAVGWRFTHLLLILLLVFGLLDGVTRPFFITFGVAFALFISLPVIASLKQPIINGRYWLLGAPALTTLVTFAARTWFLPDGRPPERKRNMRFVLACGAVFFLGASDMHGFLAAYSYVAGEMIWKGAEIVRPLFGRCPAGAPPSLFVDAKLRSTPSMSPAMTPCPILGWAEHLTRDFMSHATDADLVNFLKIAAAPEDVYVRRHSTGFVVLKRVLSRPTSPGSPPP
jgi:hypothetical protein